MAFYVAFEGIDGCGKSTQASLLFDKLKVKFSQKNLILIKEPTANTDLGEFIRKEKKIQKTQYGRKFSDGVWAALFEADRLVQQHRLHNCFGDPEQIILSDRSAISSIVYQGCKSRAILPNLVILIDMLPEHALHRIKINRGSNSDCFETIDK